MLSIASVEANEFTPVYKTHHFKKESVRLCLIYAVYLERVKLNFWNQSHSLATASTRFASEKKRIENSNFERRSDHRLPSTVKDSNFLNFFSLYWHTFLLHRIQSDKRCIVKAICRILTNFEVFFLTYDLRRIADDRTHLQAFQSSNHNYAQPIKCQPTGFFRMERFWVC